MGEFVHWEPHPEGWRLVVDPFRVVSTGPPRLSDDGPLYPYYLCACGRTFDNAKEFGRHRQHCSEGGIHQGPEAMTIHRTLCGERSPKMDEELTTLKDRWPVTEPAEPEQPEDPREEPREEARPVEERPADAWPAHTEPEAFVCSDCGRAFRYAAGLGRHRASCRWSRGDNAQAPQRFAAVNAVPGASSTARQMAEEAVAKVSGQAKERPANEPTAPAFDDTLVGWLEWLQERWEVALGFGTEQLGVDVERDLPLLRRLLDRERAR